MKSQKYQQLYFKAVIEIPGQPAALSQTQMMSIPSQYMKITEYQERFYLIEWSNPNLDVDQVFKEHVKALKRKHRIAKVERLVPITLQ